MADKTDKVLKQLKVGKVNPKVAVGFNMPNYSGVNKFLNEEHEQGGVLDMKVRIKDETNEVFANVESGTYNHLYTRQTDGTNVMPTGDADARAISVNLGTNNDVVCSATDLDIRDLASTQDTIAIATPAGDTAMDDTNDVVLVGVKGSVAYDNTDNVFQNGMYGYDGANWEEITSTSNELDVISATANTILTTIDTDTGNIATSVASIDGNITACNTGAVVVSSGAITETNSGTIAGDTTSMDGKIIAKADTITEYNVDMAVVDTEYSQALPSGTKAIEFQCRQDRDMRYAFTTGKVAGPASPWFVLKAGQTYYKEDVNLTSKTLYVATSADAGDDVELIAWS